MDPIKDRFTEYIHQLQNRICKSLEKIDGGARFREDKWTRRQGGGGKTRIIADGQIFEKGGVNTSVVHGILPEAVKKKFNVMHPKFFACGISIVIHPMNPHIPTVHANYRLFELYDQNRNLMDAWFGGGADLTPYYLHKEDVLHFHRVLKGACDRHNKDLYQKFKEDCDQYFYNTHRDEPRGAGGIFFDYLKENDQTSRSEWYDFVTGCGDVFLESYLPVVERRINNTFGEKEREWQEIRRGRYVEFNLIHDRGTLFGLKSNGRIESILMSLPPRARWYYDHHPEQGSEEAKLMEAIKDNNWLIKELYSE